MYVAPQNVTMAYSGSSYLAKALLEVKLKVISKPASSFDYFISKSKSHAVKFD